jgi:hypothetical protein
MCPLPKHGEVMRVGCEFGVLVLGLVTASCGQAEDAPYGPDGESNNAGRGGNGAGAAMVGGGRGGSSVGSGSAAGGSATAGGAAGRGGANAQGGSGNVDVDAGTPPCTGCVELRVPVTGGLDQSTRFQFALTPTRDLSVATVTFTVRALTLGDQLVASPFAMDGDSEGFAQRFTTLNAANGFVNQDTWVDLVFDVAALPPADILPPAPDAGTDESTVERADFDKSRVQRLGLNVGAVSTLTRAQTVSVVVTQVVFANVQGFSIPNVTFDRSAQGFTVNSVENQPAAELIHHPL